MLYDFPVTRNKTIKILLLLNLVVLVPISQVCCEEKESSKPIYPVAGVSKNHNLIPLQNDDWTNKIFRRNELEREGSLLAERGLYNEAIVRFRMAADASLIAQEHEKAVPIGYIVRAYERQGKFEDALKENEWFIVRHKNPADSAIEEKSKLLALIKARDTKNTKPIYDYINYLKTKYAKYFPPNGYMTGTSDILIDKLIHLYDYLHDYDSGIALMDEVIKYHTNHKDPNHRSAHAKDVIEYTRVKQAWELDKKTGQHGHLQEVIKTSDVIGW